MVQETVLDLRDLTINFGGLVAVDSLNMTVKKGEAVGLIGPNGAGKTTVFNLISGFYKPTRGDVVFMNEKITGLAPYDVCRRASAYFPNRKTIWEDDGIGKCDGRRVFPDQKSAEMQTNSGGSSGNGGAGVEKGCSG